MQQSDIPAKIEKPFAQNAGGGFTRTVPVASQIGVNDGAASYTDGFPPLTFTALGAGGIPVDGRDMNGVLNQISAWNRWQGVGGPVFWDGAFAASVNGYPQRAVLASAATVGVFWVSQVNNNLVDPDAGVSPNWKPLGPKPATLAEAQAGVNAVNYITPATLAGALPNYSQGNLATLGWRIGIDGVLEQQGRYPSFTSSEGILSQAFPVPFSGTPIVHVSTTVQSPGNSRDGYCQLIDNSVTSGGFQVQAQSTQGSLPGPIGFTWSAVGLP